MGKLSNIIRQTIKIHEELERESFVNTKEIKELLVNIKENQSEIEELLKRIPKKKKLIGKGNVSLFQNLVKTLEYSLNDKRSPDYLNAIKKALGTIIIPFLFVLYVMNIYFCPFAEPIY